MFKTLVQGFVFGIGFAVAWIIVVVAYSMFSTSILLSDMPSTLTDFEENFDPAILDSPPAIVDDTPKFRGTPGMFPNEYSMGRAPVLAEGSARIVGSVDADGKPIQGLRLRLILNKSSSSHWAVSGSDGSYVLKVPPGDYHITGFDLDSNSADQVLAGFVDGPNFGEPFGDVMAVTDNKSGQGLRFSYVSPVVKSVYREVFSLDEEIVLAWEPFPDAAEYEIQIESRNADNSHRDIDTLFRWSQQPKTTEASFDLTPLKHSLKAGYYYSYAVTALDADGNWLSKSVRRWGDYDFRVE